MLIVNWYSVFYWISVADGVKSFLDVSSSIFTWGAVILYMIVLVLMLVIAAGEWDDEQDKRSVEDVYRAVKKAAAYALILALVSWMGYVLCPGKKDALIIVAGGAVGNFVIKDSSARQIPSEVMTLLRDKIRSEIREVNLQEPVEDSLGQRTKEELIKIIKEKNSEKN